VLYFPIVRHLRRKNALIRWMFLPFTRRKGPLSDVPAPCAEPNGRPIDPSRERGVERNCLQITCLLSMAAHYIGNDFSAVNRTPPRQQELRAWLSRATAFSGEFFQLPGHRGHSGGPLSKSQSLIGPLWLGLFRLKIGS